MLSCGAHNYGRQHSKVILVLLTVLFAITLFVAPATSQAQSAGSNQPAVEQAWYTRLADWAVNTWHTVVNWVVEQGSHIARALTFWRDSEVSVVENPPIEESAEQPQVLGEEALAPSPIPVSAPSTSADNFQSPISNNQPITNNQLPISEPDVAPPPSLLTEQPTVETPTETTPVTTPEIIAEPAKTEEAKPQPSSSYFIPILARDTVAPTARVTALSATTTSAVFTVAWTGEDTGPASDRQIRNYDIQYQVDSGDWQDWLMNTVLLTSSFTGQDEKTYGWRARARDNAGNVEAVHAVADTRTYVNLSVPTNPAVTSHANGATLLSTTADENGVTADVEVTLSGTGDASDVVTVVLTQTSTTATTTVSLLGNWSKQFILAEGTNSFTLQSQEADGDQSSVVNFSLTLDVVPTREVVINEIAWMGTAISTADEWLELYNPGTAAVDLTGWALAASDGAPSITLAGTIAAKSYFLLERTDNTVIFDVTADQVYTGVTNVLGNGPPGELLTLRKANNSLVDKVGSSTVAWFAGDNSSAANRASMERKDPTGDGTLASNWATNDGVFINGKASDNATNIKGTPRSLNSQNTTIPRPITNLQPQYIYTTTSSIRLYWTAPNNANAASSTPATYDLRYSTGGGCPITESNWASATAATGEPTPSATAGTVATSTVSSLATNTSYCFAVKTNNGNEESSLSNVATVTTEDGNMTLLFGYPVSGVMASTSSPYLIKASITVDAGNTLTIEPGTVVKMDGAFNFTVNGTLVVGSASDSVNGAVITSRDDDTYAGATTGSDNNPGAGDWGVIAADAGTSVLTFNNAIVRYGGVGAQMIRAQNGAQVSITRSIIEYSNSHIIIIGGASTYMAVSNSTIRGGAALPTPAGDVGIGITSSARASIQGSTFTANRRGISVDTPADEANITITGNNFYANNATTGDGTKPISGLHYADTSATLMAENNWWGNASGPTLISPDFDAVTDAAMATGVGGVIDYTPFATTQFSILPSGL